MSERSVIENHSFVVGFYSVILNVTEKDCDYPLGSSERMLGRKTNSLTCEALGSKEGNATPA